MSHLGIRTQVSGRGPWGFLMPSAVCAPSREPAPGGRAREEGEEEEDRGRPASFMPSHLSCFLGVAASTRGTVQAQPLEGDRGQERAHGELSWGGWQLRPAGRASPRGRRKGLGCSPEAWACHSWSGQACRADAGQR